MLLINFLMDNLGKLKFSCTLNILYVKYYIDIVVKTLKSLVSRV